MATAIDPTVPTVEAMLLMDDEGKRIAVQYYSKRWWVKKTENRLGNRKILFACRQDLKEA
jgi:hypothetical protein